jgi:hypothetical protein
MQDSDKIYFSVLEGLTSNLNLIQILHESMLLKIKGKVKTFQKIMKIRLILTESEDQNICRNQDQCSEDLNLDSNDKVITVIYRLPQ